ncbi:LuxR C-terminal-related transcriptional regulator [Faecalimonas umbilicata]|nr:LuxR C-terminal-related transcriptional regulator [Faecalimonas umbilicata]
MADSDTYYSSLSQKQYYVDKSGVLERELERFPSVYLEGIAASGKTTAVKMLLERRTEVVPVLFRMEEEVKDPKRCAEKFKELEERMDEKNIWVILENLPCELPEQIREHVVELIGRLPRTWRMVVISREEMEESFLELLWSRKMELLPPESFLFTVGEIRRFAEYMGSSLDAEEIYKVSGGWAGCVDMMIRLSLGSKGENAADVTVEQLRQRYEIDRYIRQEMWDTLSSKEKAILTGAAQCPWINEELCRDVWKLEGVAESLRVLGRKGFLLCDTGKERWKILPVFRQCVQQCSSGFGSGGGKSKFLLECLGEWYGSHGYVREALECLKQSGNGEKYRRCMLQNYTLVPSLGVSYGEVMEWKDLSSACCYLQAVYCIARRDMKGFRRAVRRAAEGTDEKAEEVYLNLLYMDPEETLEDWLEQLESYGKRNGRARIYYMIGNSCSFLCGIRDLSGLFCVLKKEERRRARIWKEYLGEEEWAFYLLAQMEYYFEINRQDDIEDENWRYLFTVRTGENWQKDLAKLSLLYMLRESYPGERTADAIEQQKKILRWEDHPLCRKSMEAVMSVYSLQREGQEQVLRWIYDMRSESVLEINEENYLVLWYLAKCYVHLNQYEKAEPILQRLLPCFQNYHSTRFQAEALFLLALVNREEGKKNQSLRYVIESFVITGNFRYVRFYTTYGICGCETLDEYAAWMSTNFQEGWRQKKKYNYGNVLRMPEADYIETVRRLARKSRKYYHELPQETDEKLTMMEMIMLQNISLGMTNAQMCRELNLKLPTVKGHLYSLYKKLGVNSRVQALVKGREKGLLQ